MIDSLLNDAPCGYLIFDDSGLIINANQTLADLLEYAIHELVGRRFESLLGIAGKIFCQTHFFPLIILQGHATEIFLTLRTKANREVPMLINVRRKKQTENFESHCILMPVYQRKKFEADLLAAKKDAENMLSKNEQLQIATTELEHNKVALDFQMSRLSDRHLSLIRFNKVISHDAQEPIRKIAMFANIIAEGNEILSNRGKHALSRIQELSAHMRTLILCLEQYVGVDIVSGVKTISNLKSLIEDAKSKAHSLHENISINIRFPENTPDIICYPEQMILVFYHLIDNSIRYKNRNSASAEISVECDIIQQNTFRVLRGKYKYVDFIRLKFSDQGIGFPEKYRDYIFQLFTHVHDNSGLGFGLALCKKIIENHSGAISAASDGQGASFTILIPMTDEISI